MIFQNYKDIQEYINTFETDSTPSQKCPPGADDDSLIKEPGKDPQNLLNAILER